jgi:class 3 adenylate cyclase
MQSDNYKWGVEFIAAETDRILHEKFNPSAYYNAIESARKGSMMLPAMIIRLQLVRIMMKTDHPDRFDELEKVRAELMNYEMDGIVQVLNQTYQASPPQPRGAITKVYSASTKGTNYISNLQFDSLTFIKSIEALTGELQLDKLLNRLMNFALENAGADYGCFMLRRGAHFDPVIEMYADGGIFTDQGEIPATIFNYVVQSREPLMLSNASEGAPFSTDSLVMKNNERSILCIPFTNKGQINGVIYLTNRLTENAFIEERVGLLKVLAGQISLSIENALLYENMENLVKERTSQLEKEKKKSDRLLLNVLPEQVANELKRSGKASPKFYEEVTIMFCDFKNFTNYAEIETPEALIEELDYCLKAFDSIIGKYNIEKIKTIGDAYLCVSGLPASNSKHAIDIVNAAIDLQNWMRQETEKRNSIGNGFLELRIGINTGPVVAGVVGATKFAYDIWGDAVNTAARMAANKYRWQNQYFVYYLRTDQRPV